MFDLIPTEPLEYQIYADWLEDQGSLLTTAVRKGILLLEDSEPQGCVYKEWEVIGSGYYSQGDGSGRAGWLLPVIVLVLDTVLTWRMGYDGR